VYHEKYLRLSAISSEKVDKEIVERLQDLESMEGDRSKYSLNGRRRLVTKPESWFGDSSIFVHIVMLSCY